MKDSYYARIIGVIYIDVPWHMQVSYISTGKRPTLKLILEPLNEEYVPSASENVSLDITDAIKPFMKLKEKNVSKLRKYLKGINWVCIENGKVRDLAIICQEAMKEVL